MTMYDDRTVFDKMLGRPLPDYYDTMYLDGFSESQILAAAHKTMLRDYLDAQEPIDDMEVHVTSNLEEK